MLLVLDDVPVEDNVFRPSEEGAVGEGLLGLGLGKEGYGGWKEGG